MKADTPILTAGYFLSKWFEELVGVPNKAIRVRIWYQAFKDALRTLQGLVLLSCLSTVYLIALYVVVVSFRSRLQNMLLPDNGWYAFKLSCFVTMYFVGGVVFVEILTTIFLRNTIRRAIWRRMGDAGFSICRTCGYSLQGLRGHKCPECGEWFSVEQVENWRGEPIETPTIPNSNDPKS